MSLKTDVPTLGRLLGHDWYFTAIYQADVFPHFKVAPFASATCYHLLLAQPNKLALSDLVKQLFLGYGALCYPSRWSRRLTVVG